MNNLLNKVRAGIVTLAAVGMAAPHGVFAKGPSNLASNANSHVSSSVVGHVARTATTNKSNTPSNIGPAPKQNILAGALASQLSTKVTGKLDTSNDVKTLGPAPLGILHAEPKFKLKDTSDIVSGKMTNFSAGTLQTHVQGTVFKNLAAGNHTDSLLGDVIPAIPNPITVGIDALDIQGAVDFGIVLTDDSHLEADPSGPLSAGIGIGQPEMNTATTPDLFLSRATGKVHNNFSAAATKNYSPALAAADNSNQFTSGALGNQTKYRTPMLTAANESNQFNHGQLDSGKLKLDTTSIPSGKQQPPAGQTPTLPPNKPSHNLPQFPMPSGSASSADGSADVATSTLGSTPTASDPSAKVAISGADLVLEDIQLASPATLVAGPAYTIKFRNQGTDAATKFQVGILAGLDGKLADDAPRAVIEVKSLAAGKSGEVTLRLPQSALKFARADNRPIGFTHLFVAVDLMNTVAETDETNNTAVVDRDALETAVAN